MALPIPKWAVRVGFAFLNLKATPRARLRYRGNYHDVEGEVIDIDTAHALLGGPSTCGCWEQGRTEQCVLFRPVNLGTRNGKQFMTSEGGMGR